METSSLLLHITTSKLDDGKWKGTTHAYILHWQDQVRKYHDLNPTQTLPQVLQQTMLENAVQPMTELCAVQSQAAQHAIHTGVDLMYEEYCALLLSAAQQHDQMLSKTPLKAPKRNVYWHKLEEPPDIDGEQFINNTQYDIDHPVEIVEVNVTNFYPGPRLTSEQWH